ncbi:thiamine pyrophosphate-dependent enzyme [Chloroflexota bacterium]
MKRYEAMEVIIQSLNGSELVITSTGMISRELFAVRDAPQNFYMLGSMGLASSIGLGLALSLPEKQVIVIEGDGSILMNMGSMATIGHFAPKNLIHIVLDNEAHDSTGGQATVSNTVKLEGVAHADSYRLTQRVASQEELRKAIRGLSQKGPAFLLVKVEKGGIEGIGRVTHSPEKIKNRFQELAIRI